MIRDLIIDFDVLNKGIFLGVIEYSEILKLFVLEYIKNLGVIYF